MASCTKDNEEVEPDPIIGVWKPVQTYTLYEDGVSEQTYIHNECERRSRYHILESGEINLDNYLETINGDCVMSNGLNEFISGTWRKINGNEYESSGTYRDLGTNNVYSETETWKVSFPSENSMIQEFGKRGVTSFTQAEFERVK